MSRNLSYTGQELLGLGLGEADLEYTGPNSVPCKLGNGFKTFLTHPGQRHPQFPFVFVQLHSITVHRQFWSRLVGLPTCRNYFQ